VRIGAEQQMPYFVRDRETHKRRRVDGRLTGQPSHTIGINRGECACAGRRVNE